MELNREVLEQDFLRWIDKLQTLFNNFLDDLKLLRSKVGVEEVADLNFQLGRLMLELAVQLSSCAVEMEKLSKLRISQMVKLALKEKSNE